MSPQDLNALISVCEKEPIHIPGGVQPFGALLAYTPYFDQLCHISANAADILAQEHVEATPQELFSSEFAHRMLASLQLGDVFSGIYTSGRGKQAITAYVSEPYWVVEVENLAADEQPFEPSSVIQHAFEALQRATTPQDLLQTLSAEFRRYSGFERVMVYTFDEQWNGQVEAETVGQALPSLIGHHFPASDLPAQARAMYSNNAIRIINSAYASPSPLYNVGTKGPTEPVDMSLGCLRAVSPVHLQYLQNLGVAASCSVAMFHEQRLWALVACHHTSEVSLQPARREALKVIVDYASQRYFLLQARQHMSIQQRVRELRDLLLNQPVSSDNLGTVLQAHMPAWLRLLNCSGCALAEPGEPLRFGEAPAAETVQALTQWLSANVAHRPYWTTEEGHRTLPPLAAAAEHSFPGVLAIPAADDASKWLIFFRREYIEIKKWAGKPEKIVYQGVTGDMLGPRQSFALWQQRVEGKARPWSDETLEAARDIARDILLITRALKA